MGKSILARGLSWCPEGWGWALPPGAEPSEPRWVPTGFRVAGPDSAHKGTSALLAEKARHWGWTGYAIPAFWEAKVIPLGEVLLHRVKIENKILYQTVRL